MKSFNILSIISGIILFASCSYPKDMLGNIRVEVTGSGNTQEKEIKLDAKVNTGNENISEYGFTLHGKNGIKTIKASQNNFSCTYKINSTFDVSYARAYIISGGITISSEKIYTSSLGVHPVNVNIRGKIMTRTDMELTCNITNYDGYQDRQYRFGIFLYDKDMKVVDDIYTSDYLTSTSSCSRYLSFKTYQGEYNFLFARGYIIIDNKTIYSNDIIDIKQLESQYSGD